MKRPLLAALAALAALPVAFLLLLTLAAMSRSQAFCGPSSGTASMDLAEDQTANARVIVAVGERMAVPPYGLVVAIAAALQESGLRNLRYGDRDSLGLFQQRPSQGWGSPIQVLDPAYAATQFYARLLQVPGWERLPVTVAAQAVQRSAYPDAYAQWVDESERIVGALTQRSVRRGAVTAVGMPNQVSSCTSPTLPPVAVARVLNLAAAQVGEPYVYGATGPDAWDCSSLVRAAFAEAGLTMPRTAAEQYDFARSRGHLFAGPPGSADLRSGDLLFSVGAVPRAAADGERIGHVAIYAGDGRVLQARSRASGVTSSTYTPEDFSEVTWVARLTADPREEPTT